jgi:hypothetical protein
MAGWYLTGECFTIFIRRGTIHGESKKSFKITLL